MYDFQNSQNCRFDDRKSDDLLFNIKFEKIIETYTVSIVETRFWDFWKSYMQAHELSFPELCLLCEMKQWQMIGSCDKYAWQGKIVKLDDIQ